MATKKITLNELRSLVKQIIKEEMVLKEALNKDIKEFGRDLGKYLTNAGFQVKYVNGRISDENRTYLNTNTGLVAFETDQNQDQQSLYLYFNPKEKSKIETIVNKFQLTPYRGKPMNAGWTKKQVVGALNPGDIFIMSDNENQGMYMFFRMKNVDTKTATTDSSGKTTYSRQQQPVSENLRLRNYFK